MRASYQPIRTSAYVVLVMVFFLAGCKETQRSADRKNTETSNTVSVPGDATLEINDQKAKTTIKGVALRKQADTRDEFSKAGKGQSFLTFETEVENVGKTELALGGGYSLKTPAGKTLDYTGTADGDKAILFDEPIPPGGKKAGTMTWEVPTPKKGQTFVVIWKPNPSGKQQARFSYTHE